MRRVPGNDVTSSEDVRVRWWWWIEVELAKQNKFGTPGEGGGGEENKNENEENKNETNLKLKFSRVDRWRCFVYSLKLKVLPSANFMVDLHRC